jgi:hypothetical protein
MCESVFSGCPDFRTFTVHVYHIFYIFLEPWRGSSDGVDLYLKYDLTFHIFNLENEIFENFNEISGQIFG